MTARPIESLLQEARELLEEADSRDMGAIWRTQFRGWTKEAADWAVGYQDHQAEQVELNAEKISDPATDKRLSNLEQGLTQLALAVLAMTQVRWQMAQDVDPEAEVELLDGSKIKAKAVPLGPDGMPEEEWAMANCPCPTHEEKRSRKAAAEQQVGSKPADPATGMYL